MIFKGLALAAMVLLPSGANAQDVWKSCTVTRDGKPDTMIFRIRDRSSVDLYSRTTLTLTPTHPNYDVRFPAPNEKPPHVVRIRGDADGYAFGWDVGLGANDKFVSWRENFPLIGRCSIIAPQPR